MADPVEVAIEAALLERATAFAAAQSPSLTISLPNIAFTPPVPSKSAQWLRASFLPVPTAGLGVSALSTNQHYGMMQIDAVGMQNAGEMAVGRLASAIIAYFAFGTQIARDGFRVQVWKPPYRASLLRDDPWALIPVSIPYVCFAPN